jgi:hypothetical protein
MLVYKGPNVVIDSVDVSDGVLQTGGEALVEQEEYVAFTNENEKATSRPVYAIHTFQWLGRNLGVPVIQTPQTSILITTDGNKLHPADKGTAVAYMRYSSKANLYGLKAPTAMDNPVTMHGLGEYPIQVRVVGTFTPPPIGS